MPITEREAFSDTDSDEEDSDYEEVVIPTVKRKREIEEENSNVKRTKFTSKPKIPRLHLSRPIPANKSSKRRPRVSKGAPGLPSWQAFKTVQTKQVEALIYLFSKIIREGKPLH